ncbi:uncharacterized protein LY79DRAFT_548463 [Colletotrichum navitas]|uniref:Secreted protein n=1 Tax=Colletotrichum navitas TaxID=681940 RepID=A0AAD8V7K2_9PEZI|nr:uncharacterized protein LY79DRAFT_548463 [Colletotrichum navitas]KAK1594786.1 hypothetical protein LY79DRAFT_548463 [Colletotrichum navitas]
MKSLFFFFFLPIPPFPTLFSAPELTSHSLLRLGSEWVSAVMHVRHSAPAVSISPRLAIKGLSPGPGALDRGRD